MRTRPLLWFFLFAYAISWAFWLPVALAHFDWIDGAPSRSLHLAGGLGPMLSAILVSAMSERGTLARLWTRCSRGDRWLGVGILVPLGLFFLAVSIIAVFSDTSVDWRSIGRNPEFPEFPLAMVWILNVVFYGYGEEVGWRGFALPRLQSRASALRASVVVAIGWAGWHLPLFAFAPGLSSLGLPGAIGWFVSLVLGSILLTGLFNLSRGSIAAVALFHAALDIFMTSPVATELPSVMGALLTAGSLLLIPVFGRENLAWRPRVVELWAL